jgi:GT2 family glycosyltransferase
MSPAYNSSRSKGVIAKENPAVRDAVAAETEWLVNQLRGVERRLERVENSLIFRFLRAVGSGARMLKDSILSNGPAAMRDAYTKRRYRKWLARRARYVRDPEGAERWTYRPRLAIFLRMRGAPPARVRSAVESLFRQTYMDWQLIPEDPRALAAALEPGLLRDPRITDVDSFASDYVAFVDGNDLLDADALQSVMESVQSESAELIYADEDLVDDAGEPIAPEFKPDWSPALLDQCMYLGNFLIVRRESLTRVYSQAEWSQADLCEIARNIGERGERVVHIPRILYHHREKPQPVNRRRSSKIGFPANEPVSVIICSRTPKLLRRCLTELHKTAYSAFEIVVVQHEVGNAATNDALRSVAEEFGCRRLSYYRPFNFSEMNNLAVGAASANHLVFLNDDVRPLTPDWLEKLTAPLSNPRTGIIGAKLLYPNGTIQHAGITIGMGGTAGHPGRYLSYSPHWKWLDYTREVSAVTGACLAIRRDVFHEIKGFDPSFPVNYNDVDLCLRARQAGYSVLIETSAPLRHLECQTRTGVVTMEERRRFYNRWSSLLRDRDPYYNSNLTLISENVALRLDIE